jgi:hypothetical protein
MATMKPASHLAQAEVSKVRRFLGRSVLFKSKGLQPFVPGFEARTRAVRPNIDPNG